MNIRLDASAVSAAYSTAFRRLRELPGFDQQVVLRGEMGSVLKAWAGAVRNPNIQRTDLNSRLHVLRKFYLTTAGASSNYVSINAGLRGSAPAGTIWFRTKNNRFKMAGLAYPEGGKATMNPKMHFTDEEYTGILESTLNYVDNAARAIAKGRASMGLAQQSIVQSADQLGIDLAGVPGGGISVAALAKARAAIATSGRAYQNGIGNQGGDGTKCYLEAINRLPYAARIGMDTSLAFVLSGRAQYIEQSYKKGAFDSMKKAAAAFPNIFNTAGLS